MIREHGSLPSPARGGFELSGAAGISALTPFSELAPAEDAPRMLMASPFALPLGEPAMLYGDGGVGKSWLAYQAAVAVATGTPLFGNRPTRAPVLLLDFENRPDEVWRRIASVAADKGFTPTGLNGWIGLIREASTGNGLSDVFPEVLYLLEVANPTLVVVDGWQSAFGGDPVDAANVTDAVRMLRALAGDDRAVLVMHHVSTAGQARASNGAPADPAGNRFIRQLMRVLYYLKAERDGRATLTVTKENYGLRSDVTTLVRKQVEGLVTFELPSVPATLKVDLSPAGAVAPPDLKSITKDILRAEGDAITMANLKRRVAEVLGKSSKQAGRDLREPLAELEAAGEIRSTRIRNSKLIRMVA